MDLALLQKWLGLPSGAWPPEDRVLLGLPPGPPDGALAETRALERMELLRPHQLLHPELVTEGMNRLAQALITVTAPPAPAVEVGFAPVVLESLPIPEAEADVLEAELIEAEQPRPRRRAPPLPPAPLPTKQPEVEPEPLPIEPAPVGAAHIPKDRREGYRELVAIRHWLAAWDRLRTLAGMPSEEFRTAAAVYRLRIASDELRSHRMRSPFVENLLGETGRNVLAVFGHPQPATVLRELIPGQRQGLAADWARGRAQLAGCYLALRQALKISRPRKRLGRFFGRLREFLRTNPEWMLAALTLALLAVGWWRLRSSAPTE